MVNLSVTAVLDLRQTILGSQPDVRDTRHIMILEVTVASAPVAARMVHDLTGPEPEDAIRNARNSSWQPSPDPQRRNQVL